MSLKGQINGDVWYRLIMTLSKTDPPAGSTAAPKWTVTGTVFTHTDSRDPSSALHARVPGAGAMLTYAPKVLPDGVTSPGQNGILGSSISGVLNGSVTNFSNDPARCSR